MKVRNLAVFEKRLSREGVTTWRVKIRRKGFPDITASFPRRVEAEKWASKVESDIRMGILLPESSEATKHTVSDLIQRYGKTFFPDDKFSSP